VHFTVGIERSGILELAGNPYHLRFHQPTWYFDIDLGDTRKRLKAYGAGNMEPFTGADSEYKDVWAVALAVAEVEEFDLRVP
jgi:hypothetical protein